MNYCPYCAKALRKNSEGEPGCAKCGFVHYNTPVAVASVLLPFRDGIVLVKRGKEPFSGEWCLPRGFLKPFESPQEAAIREIKEETNLDICIAGILNAHGSARTKTRAAANLVTIFFLGKYIGGLMRAGDDAAEVQVFAHHQLPVLCFASDNVVVSGFLKSVSRGSVRG